MVGTDHRDSFLDYCRYSRPDWPFNIEASMNPIKTLIETFKSRPIAVMGLGVSGMAVVRAVLKNDGRVIAWDDQEQSRLFAKQLGADIDVLDRTTLRTCALLVLAPGIPHEHQVVKIAHEIGLEVICDIELFHRLNHGQKTIGITGTNGKSTTTALIHHVLNHAGIHAVMGGNIGKAVFDLEIPQKETVFVFELSSYQLDLCPTYHPDVAVLLNISPDHLDRHGTMDDYVAAKRKILAGAGTAVIGVDDEWCQQIAQDTASAGARKVTQISVLNAVEDGVYVEDGALFEAGSGRAKRLADISDLPALKGVHNYQNVAAAWAVCKTFSVTVKVFTTALASFAGLPHRQYPVRNIGLVSYINDSKATNADSTAKALETFDRIFWIVGGRAKTGGLEGLEIYKNKIQKAYLIGEAIPAFQRWMGRNHINHTIAHVLQVAIEKAHKDAQEFSKKTGQSAVVLLSPACASFDQFKSFERRGERFVALVQNLKA
jgi:UDP-N-acetylmuramoylalanine--D-glutamate ligase